MRVKDEKEDIITRSERVQERHKNGTALRVVSFSRERDDCEKEDEKSHIVFTSSFQKFKRERRTSPKPRHHHHHNKRAQTKREKERTHIIEYLETG